MFALIVVIHFRPRTDQGRLQAPSVLAGERTEGCDAVVDLGEAVWISARDDNRVVIYDTRTFRQLGSLPAEAPSGIFFTSRAARIGF